MPIARSREDLSDLTAEPGDLSPSKGIQILGTDGTDARALRTTADGTLIAADLNVSSTGNSTTTPLAANAIFTGTFEDVTSYAVAVLSIVSDQSSASSGFQLQWSSDGVNVDRTESTNLVGGTGRAFNVSVRARYFRIRYTNGSTLQTYFRLAVDYHSSGSGLISKPLSGSVTDDNFAQLTESVLVGKRLDGVYGHVGLDNDNQLLTGATTVLPTYSLPNSTMTPLGANGVFQGTQDDVSKFVSIDVSIIADQNSIANGLVFEFSIDGVLWDFAEAFTIQKNLGQAFSLAPRAKFFRIRLTNGTLAQTTLQIETAFYCVNRSIYTQNLNVDVPSEKAVEVVRSVLAAQKEGGRTNPFLNLQATDSGLLKTAVDTVIFPATNGALLRQKKNVGPVVGTSLVVTTSLPTVAGNTVIAVVQQGQGSVGATYLLSDTQSNLYTRAGSVNVVGVGQCDLWYANSFGGQLTVTAANFSVSSTLAMQIYEVSGLVVLGAATDKLTGTAGIGTSLPVGPAVTSKDSEFCVAVYSAVNTAVISPGPGWSSDLSVAGFGCFSQIPPAGSLSSVATASVSTTYVALLATFLPRELRKPLATDANGRLLVKAQLTDNNFNLVNLGQQLSASSIPVVLPSDQPALPITFETSTLGTTSIAAQSTSSGVLISANSARRGLIILNEIPNGLLFLKFGAGASLVDYAVRMLPHTMISLPFPTYTGQITGIWTTAGSGNARITEFT